MSARNRYTVHSSRSEAGGCATVDYLKSNS
jgi:hypothetical protein